MLEFIGLMLLIWGLVIVGVLIYRWFDEIGPDPDRPRWWHNTDHKWW